MSANHFLSYQDFLTISTNAPPAATLTTNVDDVLSPVQLQPIDLKATLDIDYLQTLLQLPPVSYNHFAPTPEDFNNDIASLSPVAEVIPEVSIEEISIPSCDEYQILLRVFRPKKLTTPPSAFYWIYGDSFVSDATVAIESVSNAKLALELNIIVVSVDYYLVSENSV